MATVCLPAPPSQQMQQRLWDSVDAIRAFAGDDIDAVVLYPQDARYLVGESTVTHYQVVAQIQPAPGQAREPHDEER